MLKAHFRPTLLLAYPVVLSQLGHVFVGVCDTVMVGHLGELPLAAVSLGISVTMWLLVLGLGISMGNLPRVAAAHGRQDHAALGRLLVGAVWTNSLVGVALVGVSLLLPPVLGWLRQPAEVVALAAPWVRVIGVSLLPLMVFQGFREWAEGLGLTRQAMYLSVAGNLLNALLCYALIFGHFGSPAFGLMGAAWASLAARVLMAGGMVLFVLRAPALRPYRPTTAGQWLRPGGAELRGQLALGLPIGGQMMCEVGAFSAAALLMGWIGVATQAAHQVAINVAGATYMAASGISAAATIRVGNLRGVGDAAGARQAGLAAYWLAFGFMGTMGVLLLLLRHVIPPLYGADATVAAQAATLLAIAAGFQVSDGLQVVGLGALRGLEDVKVPSVVALLAYWALALPLGYALGFGLHLGAAGIWLGLLTGLTVVAGVLLLRFLRLSRQQPAAPPAPGELLQGAEAVTMPRQQVA
ncbi:MATE family efflux transporter [Hymenobacter sp. RP-2-7]|uniref:Multidrug-efflux transporter n=1 Tax=Hymenobacter polaris TaxID=2682546 RepID=A0A7Y0ACC1_9BACT|nr:MATE family efflux transporter [Hymenobacter polaris]NML64732.1 MATE family efflux transporter [Hymenobacter polaris]